MLNKEEDLSQLHITSAEIVKKEVYPSLVVELQGIPTAVIAVLDFDGTTAPEFTEKQDGFYERVPEKEKWTDEALAPGRAIVNIFNHNKIPYGPASSRALGECLHISEILDTKQQGPIVPEDGAGLWIPGDDPVQYLPKGVTAIQTGRGWFVHTSHIRSLDVFEGIFDRLRQDGFEGSFVDTIRAVEPGREDELATMSKLLRHENLEATKNAALRMASAFLVTDTDHPDSALIRRKTIEYGETQGLTAIDYGDHNPVILRPKNTDKFLPYVLYAEYIKNRYGIAQVYILAAGNAKNDLELTHGLANPNFPQVQGRMILMAKGEKDGSPIYHLTDGELNSLPKGTILSHGIGPEGLYTVSEALDTEILSKIKGQIPLSG